MHWHNTSVSNETAHLGIKLTVNTQETMGLRVEPAFVFMFRINLFDWKGGDGVRGGRC